MAAPFRERYPFVKLNYLVLELQLARMIKQQTVVVQICISIRY
jgi:hypothetical protein